MHALLAISLVLIVAPIVAALMRRLNVPGWAVVGGLIAGILLGPTIFGRMMPNNYEVIFVGGQQQREKLESVLRRHSVELRAAEQAADADDLREIHQRHTTERDILEHAWRDAQWSHQRPQRIAAIVLIVGVLLGTSACRTTRTAPAADAVAPLTIGLWAATIPGAIAGMVTWRWFGYSPAEAALLAGAVMAGPWLLLAVDRRAADRAEAGGAMLMRDAGRIATLAALAVIAWALWSLEALPWLAALSVIGAAWFLQGRRYRFVSTLRQIAQNVAIPALTASLAVKIELFQHTSILLLVLLVILSGDGRWLGATIGTLLLGGRTGRNAMRLALAAMPAGPNQLAIIAVAAHAWLVDERATLALLAGVLYIEISVPMRRLLARELERDSSYES